MPSSVWMLRLTWSPLLTCSDRLSLTPDNCTMQVYIFSLIYKKLFLWSCVTKHLFSCQTNWTFNSIFFFFYWFVCSNRSNACLRSLGRHQQDNITSTWWLRITFLCPNGSNRMLHSQPWAPSQCTSRWLVRPSTKYGNESSVIVFLIPCRCILGKGQFAWTQGQRWQKYSH